MLRTPQPPPCRSILISVVMVVKCNPLWDCAFTVRPVPQRTTCVVTAKRWACTLKIIIYDSWESMKRVPTFCHMASIRCGLEHRILTFHWVSPKRVFQMESRRDLGSAGTWCVSDARVSAARNFKPFSLVLNAKLTNGTTALHVRNDDW
jgi:hypothetical protein